MKTVNSSNIKKILPKRNWASNKTDGGSVLIIGGGSGFYGAGILAALAATRTGAGYTHLMSDLAKFPWVKFPDFIVHPIKLSELLGKENFTLAVGPGLGVTLKTKNILKTLIEKNYPQVVLDADALTLLSQLKVKKLPSLWVLTPHEGELARLLGVSAKEIKKNREAWLLCAQEKYGCIILLKGAETLITDSTQTIYKIKEGTPSLAKAGAGDVLLGIIAAMMAQKIPPLQAAIVASFIHGKGAQLWEKEKNDHLSMRPLDLIDRLPKALYQLRRQSASPKVFRK